MLAINEPVGFLPRTVRCPVCLAVSLDAFQDTTNGGSWHWCRSCSFSGDILELYTAARNLEPVLAYFELVEAGLAKSVSIEDFNRYHHWFVVRRQEIREAWQKARNRFRGSADFATFRRHIGAIRINPDLWDNRGGQFVGAIEKEALSKLLDTQTIHSKLSHSNSRRIYQAGRLRGQTKTWRQAIVIPFYDVPGRISGLWLASYNGEDMQQTYSNTSRYLKKSTNAGVPAPGVAMLSAVLGARSPLIIFDPLTAIYLHVRHLAEDSTPLPLGVIWPASEIATVLRGAKATLWSETCTADLIRHAWAIDAMVSVPADGFDLKRSLTETPRRWMDEAMEQAVPWSEALERMLRKLDDIQIDAVLRHIDLPVNLMQRFTAGCLDDIRERIDLTADLGRSRVVKISGASIIETEEGLIRENTREIILNAAVRINEVIKVRDIGKTFYRGTITKDGRTHEFIADQPQFDRTPGNWLKQFMLEKGEGLLVFNRHWMRHLVEIVTTLRMPVAVSIAGRYGWDETSAKWIMPDYAISNNGRVEKSDLSRLSKLPMPKVQIGKPEKLPPESIDRLSSDDSSAALTWAVAIAIVHNLTAVPFHRKTVGYQIVGTGSAAAVSLAEIMGCLSCSASRYKGVKLRSPAVIREMEASSGWPAVVYGTANFDKNMRRWIDLPDHNCLVATAWYQSRLLGSSPGWFRIETDSPRVMDETIEVHAARLIPSFLKWFCDRHMMRTSSGDEFEATVSDLRLWFDEIGGDKAAVDDGRALIARGDPEGRARGFLEMVGRMLNDRDVTLTRHDFRPDLKGIILLSDKRVWIPQQPLLQIIAKLHSYPLNVEQVFGDLRTSGLAKGEMDIGGEIGWIFEEDLWNESLQKSRGPKPRIANV